MVSGVTIWFAVGIGEVGALPPARQVTGG